VHSCAPNPDIDFGRLELLLGSLARAKSDSDFQSALEYFKESLRSDVVREIRRLAEGADIAPAYHMALGYMYLAYVDALIASALDGITRSPHRSGYYYPPADCCAALEGIRSAWLHFVSSVPVPLEAHARAWAAGIRYELPCRVPDATVHLLRSMRQYLVTLSFTLSLA
jgi:hypothetical protein